jgi:hypothetical protein
MAAIPPQASRPAAELNPFTKEPRNSSKNTGPPGDSEDFGNAYKKAFSNRDPLNRIS